MPAVAGECKSCKNGMALHEGGCVPVDECRTAMGRQVSGKGRFGLVCEEPHALLSSATASAGTGAAVTTCNGKVTMAAAEEGGGGEACWCGGDCHKCSYNLQNGAKNDKTCTTCKNGKVLMDNGECALRAKCVGTVNGVGRFGQ